MLERNVILFMLLTYSADKFGVNPIPGVDGVILLALAVLVTWKIYRTSE